MLTFGKRKTEHGWRVRSARLLRRVRFALGLVAALLAAVSICASAEEGISWTEDELAFLREHPVVRIGVDPEFIPFEFIDEHGEYKGIAADYIALISRKTGLTFQVTHGLTWPQAYDMATSGQIDMLPAVGKTHEREQHFLFSEPYYYFKRVIVTRNSDTGISNIEDLLGQTVAVQRNSSHHSYLQSLPSINLSIYNSVEAALTAVATGTERAYVGNLATASYLIRSTGLTNLRTVAFDAESHEPLHFAVRRDWPELVSILNKALGSITDREKQEINRKWIDLQADNDYAPLLRILIVVVSFGAALLGVSFFWIARLKKEVRQRIQIQQDLEQAKREAVEASEFKSSFLARMSHEIRTPLNAITGMAICSRKAAAPPPSACTPSGSPRRRPTC